MKIRKASYVIDPHDRGEVKGYELLKVANGVVKETNNQWLWKVLPFVLLLAFFCVVVFIILPNGGVHVTP